MQTICIYKAQFVANCIHLGNPSNSVTQSNISCCFTIVAVQTKYLNYKCLNSWPSQFKDSSLNYCHFSKEDQIHKQFIQHKEQRGVKNKQLEDCSNRLMDADCCTALVFHAVYDTPSYSSHQTSRKVIIIKQVWKLCSRKKKHAVINVVQGQRILCIRIYL